MRCCGEQKVTIMLLKVDLECYDCYKKVKRLLCKFRQIRNQVYDEKQNLVIITVVCCSPEKIHDRLCSRGGKSIKGIEIKEPTQPKPTPPPQPQVPQPQPQPLPQPQPHIPQPQPKPQPQPQPPTIDKNGSKDGSKNGSKNAPKPAKGSKPDADKPPPGSTQITIPTTAKPEAEWAHGCWAQPYPVAVCCPACHQAHNYGYYGCGYWYEYPPCHPWYYPPKNCCECYYYYCCGDNPSTCSIM